MQEKNNTIQNEIINGLKKTPSLKKPWYNPIVRTLTLPFRIVVWPFRYLLMYVIAPITKIHSTEDPINATTLEGIREFLQNLQWKELNMNFDYTEIKYKTQGLFNNCRLVHAFNSKDKETAIESRQLVINFGGNGQSMSYSIKELEKRHANVYPLKKIEEEKNDVMFVDYPKGATSSGEIVDAGVSAIKRAIKAGYQPENISITGYSLGGAISAQVLKEMKPHLDGKEFAGYVNDRSFTNLGDVITTPGSVGNRSLNGLARALGLQLDATQAIISGLPVKQIKLSYDGDDDVINSQASLALYVKKKST